MACDLINIRPAQASDAPQLAALAAESWRYAYRGILPYSVLEQHVRRRNTRWWARQTAGSRNLLLLSYDDATAGYCSIGPAYESALPGYGAVRELYLAPLYLGLGFGSQLFRRARRELASREMSKILVDVLSANHNARAFYEAQGGRLAGERDWNFHGVQIPVSRYLWDGRTARRI